MPKAEVLQLIDDGIIPRMVAQLGLTPAATVSRVYGKKYKIDEYVGRYIDVIPAAYGGGESATRSEDYFDERIVFAIHERYTDADAVPDPWMDERLLFVESEVFLVLTDTRNPFIVTVDLGPVTVEYWVEYAEVTVAFDFGMYDQHKVFWSEIEANFRRVK